jgi:hypothetical protein
MPSSVAAAVPVRIPTWFKYYADYSVVIAWCQLLFEAHKLGHMLYDEVYHVFSPLPDQAQSGSMRWWLVFHLLTAMKLTFLVQMLLRQAGKGTVGPTTSARTHRPFWWLFNVVAVSIVLNSTHFGDARWEIGVLVQYGLVAIMYGLIYLGDINNRAVLAALHAILTIPTVLSVFKYLSHGVIPFHFRWIVFAMMWCGMYMEDFVTIDEA